MLMRLLIHLQQCTAVQRKPSWIQWPGDCVNMLAIVYDTYRCAAELQKKTAAGEYRQLEVADSKGTRRILFSKELQPAATATASIQQLMLTGPPKVEHT